LGNDEHQSIRNSGTRGEHANHYTTDEVVPWLITSTVVKHHDTYLDLNTTLFELVIIIDLIF